MLWCMKHSVILQIIKNVKLQKMVHDSFVSDVFTTLPEHFRNSKAKKNQMFCK